MISKTHHRHAPTRAIVIGGSMAGLLTARVLSDHFDQVTIVERDRVTDVAEARKGQPQAHHLHGLLAQGLVILNRYFPDLREALIAGGATVADMAETMRWHAFGGYRLTFKMDMEAVLMSRPFLESLIRQRVVARPNVTVMDECAVDRPLWSSDGTRITGIEITRRGAVQRGEQLGADLIVDTTGRGSQSPTWLEAAGYTRPEENAVKVRVGYATRVYRRDPTAMGSREWILVTPEAPHEQRMGGAFPVEGDRWVVSLGGWHDDHAPTDEQGFLEFARALPAPDISQIVSQCEPLTEIIPHKFPASLRRHYEKLPRFPEGYLVLGDAVCSFNPLYGQGMTSAALQAAELDALLRERQGRLDGIGRDFFARAAKVIDIPWQLAVGEDFRFPQTEGRKAPGTDLINAYVAHVHRASHDDEEVCRAFLYVMNLIKPPTSLFHPRILWRVLRHRRTAVPTPPRRPSFAG